MIYLTLTISIISILITVINFFDKKKEKAVDETKDESSNQALINYRLNELTKKVDKILDLLDGYDKEIKKIVDDEIDRHVAIYHNKGDK